MWKFSPYYCENLFNSKKYQYVQHFLPQGCRGNHKRKKSISLPPQSDVKVSFYRQRQEDQASQRPTEKLIIFKLNLYWMLEP